ncbi:hypothetical protein MMC25_002619 [Agyrium rufum]|nr:hypothetical protein [Agyrium rufum]
MTNAIALTQVIVFAILIQPIIYNIWAHRHNSGTIGWFTLNGLCGLRIAGGILLLLNSDSFVGLLLGSIGLSPLLLGGVGILHEVRTVLGVTFRKSAETALEIQFHLVIVGALAIVAVGASAFYQGKATSTDLALYKAGISLLIVMWAALGAWVIQTFRVVRATKGRRYEGLDAQERGMWKGAELLLYTIAASLPLLALRLAYALVNIVAPSSTFIHSLAVRWIFSVIPEMIIVALFAAVGIMTRNLRILPIGGAHFAPTTTQAQGQGSRRTHRTRFGGRFAGREKELGELESQTSHEQRGAGGR